MLEQHKTQCSMHARYQIYSCPLAVFPRRGKIAHENAQMPMWPTLVTSRNGHSTRCSKGRMAYLRRVDVLLPNCLCASTPSAWAPGAEIRGRHTWVAFWAISSKMPRKVHLHHFFSLDPKRVGHWANTCKLPMSSSRDSTWLWVRTHTRGIFGR